MTERKPVDEGCDGGVFCAVPGHVQVTKRNLRTGETTWAHIPLTPGQRKTLREQKEDN